MSEDRAFLAALRATPADDTTRLVYADWLDDRGHLAWAAYLRAVVELTWREPGSDDYTAAAAELFRAVPLTDSLWRWDAGGRFDLVLVEYERAEGGIIRTIKIIRELTGWGLAESKAAAESVPFALRSWRPFECLFPELLGFQSLSLGGTHVVRLDGGVVIRPTPWPPGAASAHSIDILLTRVIAPHARLSAGVGADYLTTYFGITPDEAERRLASLPLTLAAGVHPRDAAERVREILIRLNVHPWIPPDGIQLVVRTAPA